MTGLTARQLQWWDSTGVLASAVATHRTQAGGFTERRYTPLDVLELQALAELRRRGCTVPRLRRVLAALKRLFGVRLYETVGEEGPIVLMHAKDKLYAKTLDGGLVDLDDPSQPLLVEEDGLGLRVFTLRERRSTRRPTSG